MQSHVYVCRFLLTSFNKYRGAHVFNFVLYNDFDFADVSLSALPFATFALVIKTKTQHKIPLVDTPRFTIHELNLALYITSLIVLQ